MEHDREQNILADREWRGEARLWVRHYAKHKIVSKSECSLHSSISFHKKMILLLLPFEYAEIPLAKRVVWLVRQKQFRRVCVNKLQGTIFHKKHSQKSAGGFTPWNKLTMNFYGAVAYLIRLRLFIICQDVFLSLKPKSSLTGPYI